MLHSYDESSLFFKFLLMTTILPSYSSITYNYGKHSISTDIFQVFSYWKFFIKSAGFITCLGILLSNMFDGNNGKLRFHVFVSPFFRNLP